MKIDFKKIEYMEEKMKKKQKPAYMRVRLPAIQKTGGAHQPAKGGRYRRSQEKQNARREAKAELN